MKVLLILGALCTTAVCGQDQNVTITLFATDLSGCDSLSKCDAFVKIFCQSKVTDWKLCGQTSVKQDDNFPVWPEVFTFPYIEGNREKWRFNIIDDDVTVNDPIAQVELVVADYLNATEIQNSMSFGLDLNEKAKFYVQRVRK